MKKVKLFFTDKYYRRATLESLKLTLLSLPGIKHIFYMYHTYRLHKKVQNMDNWERYIKFKNLENNSNKFCFTAALTRLQICIMAEGEYEEFFEQAKTDILSNKLINEEKYKDFKEWLESINSTEKSYSKVQEILNGFNSK